MSILRTLLSFMAIGFCLLSGLISVLGKEYGFGSLENWLRFQENLTIFSTAIVILGAISTIAWYLVNLKTRPTVRELFVLIFFTHIVTVISLPFWEYASEHIFYHKSVSIEAVADNFVRRNCSIFICRDMGYSSLCATTEPNDKRYVLLTNYLYELAFIQGCVDKAFPSTFIIPLMIGLAAISRQRLRITALTSIIARPKPAMENY